MTPSNLPNMQDSQLPQDAPASMWVAFLKEKSKALEKFKILKNRVENESRFKIRNLRSDRGGEYTSRDFNIYCEEHGIKRQLSSPYSPEKNEIVERRNRLVVEDRHFRDKKLIQ